MLIAIRLLVFMLILKDFTFNAINLVGKHEILEAYKFKKNVYLMTFLLDLIALIGLIEIWKM